MEPAALGYPLTAFVITRVTRRGLDEVADSLGRHPEVLLRYGWPRSCAGTPGT